MKTTFIAPLVVLGLLGTNGLANAITISATDSPPETHCVTATSQRMKVSADAQLEKDIAPYKAEAKWADVISQYRQELEVAWSAMEQPFCGYGSYGAASAIKSYGKSIERARAAFLDKVKKGDTTATSLVAAVTTDSAEETAETAKTLTTPAKTITKTVAKKAIKTSAKSSRINRGLHLGMRSTAVTDLQNLLVKHFGLPADDDHVTGYFGNVTQGLIIKFQKEKGIISGDSDPGAGLVGPKTTAALNALAE